MLQKTFFNLLSRLLTNLMILFMPKFWFLMQRISMINCQLYLSFGISFRKVQCLQIVECLIKYKRYLRLKHTNKMNDNLPPQCLIAFLSLLMCFIWQQYVILKYFIIHQTFRVYIKLICSNEHFSYFTLKEKNLLWMYF